MKNNVTLCKQTHMSKCMLLQPFILDLGFSSTRLHRHVLLKDIMAWEEKVLFQDHVVLLQLLLCIRVRWGECRSGLMKSRRPGQMELPSSPVKPLTVVCQASRQGLTFPLLSSCAIQVTYHPAPRAGESSAHQLKAEFRNTLFCITCSRTMHGEEKVMRPVLPALRDTLQSPSGYA